MSDIPADSRPVVLTSDRPTGPLHLGHFCGSLRTFVPVGADQAPMIEQTHAIVRRPNRQSDMRCCWRRALIPRADACPVSTGAPRCLGGSPGRCRRHPAGRHPPRPRRDAGDARHRQGRARPVPPGTLAASRQPATVRSRFRVRRSGPVARPSPRWLPCCRRGARRTVCDAPGSAALSAGAGGCPGWLGWPATVPRSPATGASTGPARSPPPRSCPR